MQQRGLFGFTALMLSASPCSSASGSGSSSGSKWKEGLIAQIETRSTGAPITLKDALAMTRKGRDPSYYRVRVDGRFHHANELYLYATLTRGWAGMSSPRSRRWAAIWCLVDRGFVPDELRDPSSRALGQVENVVTVTGIVRQPDTQGLFMPDNEPAANRWFWRDLQGMARTAFAAGVIQVAPFFLEAEKSDVPGGWPEGGQTPA